MRQIRSGMAMAGAVFACSLIGCRVSKDAAAASGQMTVTATELGRFYGGLIAAETDIVALSELDQAVFGVPFDANARKQLEDTRKELIKRKGMADALSTLAGSFTALTSSKAATEVQGSATALGTALISANALPDEGTLPDSLGTAGRLLIEAVQQHQERKAAQAIDQTVAAMTALFQKEQPVYDAVARYQLRQAGALASDLLKANIVDNASLLAPALRPFDLSPLPASAQLQTSLRQLALDRITERVTERTEQESKASAAMLSALQQASSRVHEAASGHAAPAQGTPSTTGAVDDWLKAAR